MYLKYNEKLEPFKN